MIAAARPRARLAAILFSACSLACVATSLEAQPAAAPASEPASTAAPPKNIEPIPANEADGILGKSVGGANGENMGLVVDVLIDQNGAPRAAVIDFGGFLGVGSRKIAVDWKLLKFQPGDAKTPVLLDLDRAALQSAPEFKPKMQPILIVGPIAPDPPAGSQ
jgi:hypothetical protein